MASMLAGNPELFEGPTFEGPIGRSDPIAPSSELVAQCQASGIAVRHVEVFEDDNFSAVVDEVELACTQMPRQSQHRTNSLTAGRRFVNEHPWIVMFTGSAVQMMSGAFQDAART